LRVFDEDLVAQQILAAQPLRPDRLDPLQPALGEGDGLGAECGGIEIRHPVVVAGIALERGLDRIEREGLFPVFRVETVQLLCFRFGGLRGRRGTCGLRMQSGAEQGGGDGECEQRVRTGVGSMAHGELRR
jgi:hypothetical protein